MQQSDPKAKAKQAKAQARENRRMRWRSKVSNGKKIIRCQREEKTWEEEELIKYPWNQVEKGESEKERGRM